MSRGEEVLGSASTMSISKEGRSLDGESELADDGGALFAPAIARARCSVRAPCPVPASRISSFLSDPSAARCRSSSETIRFASAG